MDVTAITTMISTVGFPIAACCYMAYAMKNMDEKHSEEMSTMRDAITANTTALTKLQTLIETFVNKKE